MIASPKASEFNVIESIRQYNQSQINKILCIENDTAAAAAATEAALDHDVDGTTYESELPQLSQPAGITKMVVCNVISMLNVLCHNVRVHELFWDLLFML